MHTFFEKINVFNNISFDEMYHQYTIDGKRTVSVTKVTGAVRKPFDEAYWANQKATERNAAGEKKPDGTDWTPDDIKLEWRRNNLISTVLGSACHKYIESAMANKFERYPAASIKETFSGEDPVSPRYVKVIAHMNKFISDIKGKMIPVKSEVVIGSPKYLVCGMIDQIFFNKKSNQFELWDWKTNSKFDVTSKFFLEPPCDHLEDCKLTEYSLQLACYKHIFQEMTGIPLGNSYLCWFGDKEPTYHVFKCLDLDKEAVQLLEKANRG
jgi:hypothetical protein